MDTLLSHLLAEIRRRARLLSASGDAGYSVEAVVVIAFLVAAALAVLAIIVAKVTAKANSINLGIGAGL